MLITDVGVSLFDDGKFVNYKHYVDDRMFGGGPIFIIEKVTNIMILPTSSLNVHHH